jgi:hypothetical protein
MISAAKARGEQAVTASATGLHWHRVDRIGWRALNDPRVDRDIDDDTSLRVNHR